ncbi:MAG: DegV family protein, partial [Clostridia bacterium]|nr:DegV family protein [Clostridia bacterium]
AGELKKRYKVRDILMGQVGCAIGAHTGPGIVAVVFLDAFDERFDAYLK